MTANSSPDGDHCYVHYGCGLCAPPAWLNFDASPSLRVQKVPFIGRLVAPSPRFPGRVRYGDIVKGLPVPRDSCRAVYCSHVLEHLALADFRLALRNTRFMLAPGGLFRLVVPDLEHMARQYLDSDSPDAAVKFLTFTQLGVRARPRGLRQWLRAIWSHGGHRWMWDFPSLSRELQTAGFVDVRRAAYGDSHEPRFADVESEQRWRHALGIECRRPA